MEIWKSRMTAFGMVALVASCGTEGATKKVDQAPVEEPAEAVEETDASTFELPVPPRWSAKTVGEAMVVTSPEGDMEVFVVESDTTDHDEAVARAWSAWGREAPPLAQKIDAPAKGIWDATSVFQYERAPGEFSQALVRQRGEAHFVVLVQGTMEGAQKRGAQLNQVVGGLKPAGLEELDLRAATATLTDEDLATFDAFVAEQAEAFGVPGVSVAVVHQGKVVLTKGYGVARIGGEERVDEKTLMMIGSTTKPMTTLLMADLIEEGAMSWSTPVVDLIESFELADPARTQAIEVQHLACACTGVPRRDLELFFPNRPGSAEEVVRSLSTFELYTDFGETFQYSNQMVALAGYSAAAAGGGSWGDLGPTYDRLMRERVFEPIGMGTTTTSFDQVSKLPSAAPHRAKSDGTYEVIDLEIEKFVEPVAPAGAIWSNAEEMAKFAQTMLAMGTTPTGTQLVSKESVATLWTPTVKVGSKSAYGLGWFLGEYHGVPVVSHGGNTLGFTSNLVLLPTTQSGLVLLANAAVSSGFREAVELRLKELIYDQPENASALAASARELVEKSRTEFASVLGEVDPESARELVGRWTNEDLGTIEVTLKGDELQLDAGSIETTLAPAAKGPFAGKGYLFASGFLKGLPLRTSENEGERRLLLGEGTVEYVFERVK